MCVGDYTKTVPVSASYVRAARRRRVWNPHRGVWESDATHIAHVRGRGCFDGRDADVGKINRADGEPNVRLKESGRVIVVRPMRAGAELVMRYGHGYRIV